jgi:DNA-binding response OmpR family regulator
MKILLIEDDEFWRDAIIRKFVEQEHHVEVAENFQDGLELVRNGEFDVTIVDRVLPLDKSSPVLDDDDSGLKIVKAIKEEKIDTLVVGFSAVGKLNYMWKSQEGYDAGCHFYVSKKDGVSHLMQTMQGVEAVSEKLKAERMVLRVDQLILDCSKRTVTLEGKPIHLSPTQLDILALLIKFKNEVVKYEKIAQLIEKSNSSRNNKSNKKSNNVSVQVHGLRKAIENHEGSEKMIFTVHKVGYVLRERSKRNASSN